MSIATLLREFATYLLLVALILAAGACHRNDGSSRVSTPGPKQNSYAFEPTAQSSQVQWILPTNMDAYRQQMTDFAQTGGADPFPGIPMVRKPLDLQGSVEERARALAHKTAATVLENRPGATEVVQFQLQGSTAYIQFGMDVDGWAGVSVAIAMVHPLVALNLKQFPQIDAVRFEAPPEGN
ncbi:hypothetical protein [Microbulbifer rhizosphaerae]|uniref:Uncharacterized protein n=1 Tax=Microbulbifer rhizosphaerae TaxID=1562603 RepID=A0A7W4WG83_9GAMM|nr:hypothetical protein [Microbulbifer rhizosphaerae]MBB3063113.1 hypothetical protein [Microbulbifer rhizosphaerae]